MTSHADLKLRDEVARLARLTKEYLEDGEMWTDPSTDAYLQRDLAEIHNVLNEALRYINSRMDHE